MKASVTETSKAENSVVPRARAALSRLLDYCREQNWAGWDPYDALNSRLFQRTPFRHYRWPRLALTQFVKRFPLNIRPLLGISRQQNPKGIALFCSTLARLHTGGKPCLP